ncbi:hypothetical protein K435DRAFT_848687 [Dendrothele bispora CBS 962.96]|uniref:Hydrophobin n=1 Tax=Dendrothele bispora (strain CBS 962.96) TaxID=1314807 RepID=A0A4S8MUU4_DENBC|nr:hypothetical protein K435DRAFT_848687 [Dendrothele bispora CBS 962.96]
MEVESPSIELATTCRRFFVPTALDFKIQCSVANAYKRWASNAGFSSVKHKLTIYARFFDINTMFNRLSALVIATLTIVLAVPRTKAQCATGSVAECCDLSLAATSPLAELVLGLLPVDTSTLTGSVGVGCQTGSDCDDPLCCTTAADITVPIVGGLAPVAAGCSPSPA